MKILFCSSEAAPLIKTGGLADVAGSLPATLRELGKDCRLAIPAYPEAVERSRSLETVARLELPGSREAVQILQGLSGPHEVPVYLMDAPHYFQRPGNPYLSPLGISWPDNADRYALFCRAIVQLAMGRCGLDWRPDLVHTNDWQTGLVAPLMRDLPARPACVFTIHNLAYQGLFDRSTFNRLQLPRRLWGMDGLEFHGQLSFIKGGIAFADRVTTVSPTYAEEIKGPALGYGLEGLLRHRGDHFLGILNGIDYQVWDPANDPCIVQPYSADRFADKLPNKRALQREFELPEETSSMLFGYIGRLVDQKGVDLILQVIPGILDAGGQIVTLGSGDAELERALRKLNTSYHSRIGVSIGYDEGLSHRIEAGCDAFLMPSRFEPCGLNQMYSLRYGSVPIVRRTGGLADSVCDVGAESLSDGSATGFVFERADGEGLWHAIERALDFYHLPGGEWARLASTGMRQDFSWESSAAHYLEVYESALQAPLETP